MSNTQVFKFIARIVSSHAENNTVTVNDLSELIKGVYAALANTRAQSTYRSMADGGLATRQEPLRPDYLICLEDGRKFKLLKQHLRKKHGLTPNAYRSKWDLPEDYPMVTPDYAAKRSALSRESGLGRRSKH